PGPPERAGERTRRPCRARVVGTAERLRRPCRWCIGGTARRLPRPCRQCVVGAGEQLDVRSGARAAAPDGLVELDDPRALRARRTARGSDLLDRSEAFVGARWFVLAPPAELHVRADLAAQLVGTEQAAVALEDARHCVRLRFLECRRERDA